MKVKFNFTAGLAMDYRVHIDAGKEDCYYQYVDAGATMYTSMSVSILTAKLNRSLLYFSITDIIYNLLSNSNYNTITLTSNISSCS